jgi:hypothetical protein
MRGPDGWDRSPHVRSRCQSEIEGGREPEVLARLSRPSKCRYNDGSTLKGATMAKFTVQLNDEMDEILSDLARQEGIPKTQVIRRSLALLKFLQEEERNGRKLAVTDNENNVVKEIVRA